jgi:hypothetical protein
MVGLILGLIAGLILLSWKYVDDVDYMDKNHPDYKGEEFLNWDRENDNWDDNKSHTENF